MTCPQQQRRQPLAQHRPKSKRGRTLAFLHLTASPPMAAPPRAAGVLRLEAHPLTSALSTVSSAATREMLSFCARPLLISLARADAPSRELESNNLVGTVPNALIDLPLITLCVLRPSFIESVPASYLSPRIATFATTLCPAHCLPLGWRSTGQLSDICASLSRRVL